MKNKSSINQMDQHLDILKSIKRVKAPQDILELVTGQIQMVKPKLISMSFIRAIASIFILLIGFEAYMCIDYLKEKETISQTETSYQIADNILYYE